MLSTEDGGEVPTLGSSAQAEKVVQKERGSLPRKKKQSEGEVSVKKKGGAASKFRVAPLPVAQGGSDGGGLSSSWKRRLRLALNDLPSQKVAVESKEKIDALVLKKKNYQKDKKPEIRQPPRLDSLDTLLRRRGAYRKSVRNN